MKTFSSFNLKNKLLMLIALTCFSFSIQANSSVNFQNISLEEASLLDKKMLVSFSADWCLPCEIMDENLFSDEEISTLINENFIPIKADVDSANGNNWNELYNANYLPTTLFAFDNGKEIERLNGIPTKAEFLAILKRIIGEDKKVEPVAKASFVSIEKEIVEPRPTIEEAEPTIEEAKPSYSNLHIQLGAFSSISNANNLIKKLEQKNYTNHYILEEHNSNGILLYKVMLNGYASDPEVHSAKSEIQGQGFDCFVKKV